MKKWKKILSLATATALLVGSLAGCGTYTSNSSVDGDNTNNTNSSSAGTTTQDSSKVLRFAIPTDPEFTFEAIGDSLMATNNLLREGLTRYDENGVIQPALAESYEHNDDYTQWTFHLRESGWSDGSAVKADDWVYAIGAMLDGSATLSYADFLFEIKNAREVYKGTKDVSELGVTAVDDKTLVFDLEYPVTYYPSLVTHPMHLGYSREFSEKVGVANVGLEASTSISNGPFYIDSWEHNNLIVFKKNPYYWNVDNVAYDQVNVYVVPDESTQVNLFINGELDVVDFSSQRESAIKGAGYDVLEYNNGRSAYLQYNLTNQYLSNKYIRQAISSAIDREAIVNGVLKSGSVADGFIPVGLAGDEKNTFRDIVGSTLSYTYNPEASKELLKKGLDELGLKDASEIKITILAANTDEFLAVSGAIMQLLKENLGIDVEVETSDSSSVRTRRKAYDYDVVLISWGADWNDATNFLGGYEHDDTANDALYKSEAFNEKYHEATYSKDLTERVKLLGEAEAILLEDEGITPLYYTSKFYAVSDRVDKVYRRAVVPYLDLYYTIVK